MATTNFTPGTKGNTIYQMSAADLENFGFWLLAKGREEAERERRESLSRELATRQEVCDFLHISKPTFHALVNKGVLKVIKVGRSTKCDMNEIRRKVASGELGKYKRIK